MRSKVIWSLSALGLTALTLTLAWPQPAAEAQVSVAVPIRFVFVPSLPPECSDGADNDGDGQVDFCLAPTFPPGPPPTPPCDSACAGPFDGSEFATGFQPPGTIEVVLDIGPYVTVGLPDLHLIDLPALVVNPPPTLVDWVHPDFSISASPFVPGQVSGLLDSASLNLDIQYTGNEVFEPGTQLVVARLRGDAFAPASGAGDPVPEPVFTYLAEGIDVQTGQPIIEIDDCFPTP